MIPPLLMNIADNPTSITGKLWPALHRVPIIVPGNDFSTLARCADSRYLTMEKILLEPGRVDGIVGGIFGCRIKLSKAEVIGLVDGIFPIERLELLARDRAFTVNKSAGSRRWGGDRGGFQFAVQKRSWKHRPFPKPDAPSASLIY
jgi:hypothetical protein